MHASQSVGWVPRFHLFQPLHAPKFSSAFNTPVLSSNTSTSYAGKLEEALKNQSVAVLQIDVQNQYFHREAHLRQRLRNILNPRFKKEPAIYEAITSALREKASSLQMPVISVRFVDEKSTQIHPEKQDAQNILESDLLGRMKGEKPFILPKRSLEELPEGEIRKLASDGNAFELWKTHRNVCLEPKGEYYSKLRALKIDFLRWLPDKPDVPSRMHEENDRFLGKLKAERYDTVVVYGVYTDYCVNAAVGELLNRGFNVVVLPDAMGYFSRNTLKNPGHPLGEDTFSNGKRSRPYSNPNCKQVSASQFINAMQKANSLFA